jgi:regulator of protease activity HflC (stomatin/prohibitin superfamily)
MTIGIVVADVRISRANLPESISAAIYNRMKSERAKLASVIQSDATNRTLTIKGDVAGARGVVLKFMVAEAAEDAGVHEDLDQPLIQATAASSATGTAVAAGEQPTLNWEAIQEEVRKSGDPLRFAQAPSL